jgi:transcription-repair coupling factor (superfamily II helicase)
VDDPNLRVEIYRSISDIKNSEGLGSFAEELRDRFGALPEAMENLLNLAEARFLALALGVQRLVFKNGELLLEFRKDKEYSRQDIEGWHRRISDRMEFKSFDGLKMKARLGERSSMALKKTLQALIG